MELLTPLSCLGCDRDGQVLCAECVAAAAAGRGEDRCFRCGLASVDGMTCELCRAGVSLAGVSVGAYYGGSVKEVIWRLKFSRLRAAVEPAAELVVRALSADDGWPSAVVPGFDLVTAVPIAPERYRERGYNQAELIGRAVAQRLDVQYAPLLGRLTASHQVGSDRQERLVQVQGAFYGRRALRGEHVLLVDDVVTTGATLDECARVLLASGARVVWGAAVARHR